MNDRTVKLLRGTLNLLVLKALALEPLHGVALTQRIEQMTQGAFHVSFGSIFPALRRMEQQGWITGEWRVSENNRRARYYRLTRSGRSRLKTEEQEWNEVVHVMTAALESS